MKTHAFGLERLGLLAVQAPRICLAVLVALTLLAAYGVTLVKHDNDPRSVLRSERPHFLDYDRFLDRYPALENQVFILAESPNLTTGPVLEALRNLHLDLLFIDGVTSVVSIFTARKPPDENGNMSPVFPENLPDGEALDALIADARGHPLLGDKMLSASGTATLLVVALDEGLRTPPQLAKLFADLKVLTDQISSGLDLTLTPTGLPAIRHETVVQIRSDQTLLIVVGALVAILICALFFRRPSLVFLASLPPMIAILWTLGGFGLSGEKITAMTNILPTLVLVIAFSDSMHMVHSIRRQLQAGHPAREAARTSVIEIGPACALTTVTTMIALGTLVIGDSRLVQQFGVCGAAAVLLAFIAVVVLVPALAVLILPNRPEAAQKVTASGLALATRRWSERTWAFVRRRALPVSGIGTVILLITGTAFFTLEPRYDYRGHLPEDSVANRAIDRINATLGGADVIFVNIEAKSADGSQTPVPIDAIGAVHEILERDGKVENVLSLASAVTWLAGERDDTAEAAGRVLEKLPEHYAGRLASDRGASWIVTGYVPAEAAPETKALLSRLDSDLDTVRRSHPDLDISVTGLVALAAFESGNMIERLKVSLALAVVIIVAVMAATARSLTLALLATVPNLLALSVVAAVLYVMDLGFQFTSTVALTVAFGIAVDNTVHFIHRYRLERESAGFEAALEATMRKVGPVLIAATALLSAGLAVTQLSALPMASLFGLLCIIVLVTALCATLVLMPALVLVARGRARAAG